MESNRRALGLEWLREALDSLQESAYDWISFITECKASCLQFRCWIESGNLALKSPMFRSRMTNKARRTNAWVEMATAKLTTVLIGGTKYLTRSNWAEWEMGLLWWRHTAEGGTIHGNKSFWYSSQVFKPMSLWGPFVSSHNHIQTQSNYSRLAAWQPLFWVMYCGHRHDL